MNAIHVNARTILLYGLHLLIALSLPFVLVLVVGCMKISEEEPNYGEEVPGEAIDLALSKAVHGASFDGTAVGQYVKYTITRRLENEETTTLLGGTQVEVFNREDTETQAKFMLKVTKSERTSNNGEFEVKITEEPLILDKVSLVSSMGVRPLDQGFAGAMEERKVIKQTFHNLREFTQMEPAPKAVRERAGCGGMDPCELEMRYIRFTSVLYFNDGGRQKVAFDFAFNTKTPYLPFGRDFDQLNGLMVTDCRSTYVPITGRTVYVRDCQMLEDFQK